MSLISQLLTVVETSAAAIIIIIIFSLIFLSPLVVIEHCELPKLCKMRERVRGGRGERELKKRKCHVMELGVRQLLA